MPIKQDKVNKILRETHDIYNTIAGDFSVTRAKWWHILDELRGFVQDGDRVLDLGCGNGRLAELFLDKNVSYLGVDSSEELIKIAREKFANKKNIKFEVGDIIKLDVTASQSFNLVFMLAVLHHIPTKELRLKILADIYKLLKPGGTLVMSNWNIFGIKKYRPMIVDYKYKLSQGVWSFKDVFIPWKPIGAESRRYVHSFAKGEMKNLLQKAGFEIQEIYYENKGTKTSFWNGYNLMAIARKK
ncbi:MAG: class I SAM-dependent methyltransferase [Patescibacteria group bacterium]|jgi:ubiquinone/menaquinone biosynthesis C-methylase UbiE